MTHILPPHTDLNLAPSSLHSALHMEAPASGAAATAATAAATASGGVRKRKKTDGDEGGSEPRRLRRSHEACARCRSKKIKCDSKHPKCTACATAGAACQQEDRHRQTLTPRGHTEHVEHQLRLCDQLLKRYVPGFALANIDDICARDGIAVDHDDPPAFSYPPDPRQQPFDPPPPGPAGPHQHPGHLPKYPYPQILPPGYPVPIPYTPGAYPALPMQPPGPYNPHIHPAFQPPPPGHMPPHVHVHPPDIKGQDPQLNDMTSSEALAKNWGVHPTIVQEFTMTNSIDREDLAVGSSGLSSGRDRVVSESAIPRDSDKWLSVSVIGPHSGGSAPAPPVTVWLPKDRKMCSQIVDAYFSRLNTHRPVYTRAEFERTLNALYARENVQYDPGFICSIYLVLALGTLSELNHRVSAMDKDRKGSGDSSHVVKKLLPNDWPVHDSFFEQVLAVKPDLRVTISSLQALILLQWYLYTERQGRTLWRLVGSLVRLAIELGLHHDPYCQENTFTEEECQMRIRLWGIVMLHDRGTSLLLGRPLAIAPLDSDTPLPTRGHKACNEFSDHFFMSHPIAGIQADIICGLYKPMKQNTDSIARSATRIMKSLVELKTQLPESFQWYFGGTEEWPMEKRIKLVQDITEDQGLTLLKISITKILLLRALFNIKDLEYQYRWRALNDAVASSHNIIVVHRQLIRFPDIAFFVSPIPLHIAAMVILYGQCSQCERLTREMAVEDVCMALDILPRMRWRWERKDLNGEHPMITRVAEQVFNKINLKQVVPPSDPVLLSEKNWELDVMSGAVTPSALSSPLLAQQHQQHVQQQQHAQQQQHQQSSGGQHAKMQQKTPTIPHAASAQGTAYGQHPRDAHGSPGSALPMKAMTGPGTAGPPLDRMAEVPAGLFYPFYPENQIGPMGGREMPVSGGGQGDQDGSLGPANPGGARGVVGAGPGGGGGVGGTNQYYTGLLAAAAAQQSGPTYGCQPSQDSYMLEEKDTSVGAQMAMGTWIGNVSR